MEYNYFDNAATTKISPLALDVMMREYQQDFGNASSIHTVGRAARKQVDLARKEIADYLHVKEQEIIFTSGGTESNNTAIFGVVKSHPGKHIITTKIEHPSVLNPIKDLADEGYEVTYLDVDEQGLIDLDQLRKALREDTVLVSIMAVNNEVGAKMPLHEIGELVGPTNAIFHVDAVQGLGNITLDPENDQIDLLSSSAHKIHGPKLLGFLYKSDRIELSNLLYGGEQEKKRRAGTENVAGIAAFGALVQEIDQENLVAQNQAKYREFQEYLVNYLQEHDIDFAINGGIDDQHSHHVLNLWLKGVNTFVMQTNLDLAGFMVSGGSACTAGSLEPSHVLEAMFGDSPRVSESIRISFANDNTLDQVQKLAAEIVQIVKRVRK